MTLKTKLEGYNGRQKQIIKRNKRRKEHPTKTLEDMFALRAEYSEEELIYMDTSYKFKKPKKNKKRAERNKLISYLLNYYRPCEIQRIYKFSRGVIDYVKKNKKGGTHLERRKADEGKFSTV